MLDIALEIALEVAMAGLVFSATGCDQPPAAASLPEWTPADHHSSDDDKVAAGRQGQPTPAAARPGQDTTQLAQLVDVTWRGQCSSCHGPGGRGDGQMGAMLHATDLTNSEWQTRTTDAEIEAVIRNGRNRMPRFDLPDAVARGLVAKIRSIRTAR
jgi:cytochrome c oxidase cbb3-type subunit 3